MNSFRKKRVELDVSINEASEKLYISPQVLEDLENGHYGNISQPFLYYCAKNYANFLKIELPRIIKKATPINKK